MINYSKKYILLLTLFLSATLNANSLTFQCVASDQNYRATFTYVSTHHDNTGWNYTDKLTVKANSKTKIYTADYKESNARSTVYNCPQNSICVGNISYNITDNATVMTVYAKDESKILTLTENKSNKKMGRLVLYKRNETIYPLNVSCSQQ